MTNPVHPTDDHEQQSFQRQESHFEGHVISVNFNKMSEGEKSLERSFLSHLSERFSSRDNPVFSADAKHTQYLLNDFLTVGRNLGGLLGVNQDTQNVIGEAGGSLIGTGLATLVEGSEAEKLAKRTLNIKAQKEAKITKKLGATETVMGASMMATRSLNLASDAKGVSSGSNATTSLGQATFSLGMIGGIFSSVWYGLLGFSAWSSLKEVWRVEDNLKDPDEAIGFLKEELNFGVDKTLEVLKESYKKEYPNTTEDSTPLVKPSFADFCKKVLDKEAVDLAKEFLQTINPDPSKTYDFQAQAEKMMSNNKLKDVTANGDSEELKKLDLSSSQLLGFESLHRSRLEMAKTNLSRSIGEKALGEVLEFLEKSSPTEDDKQALLESVHKGLSKAKIENIVVLAFVGFGLAVAVASTVGACIACPPLGLIVACAVCSIIITALISYVDLELLLKNWDAPVGKLEEATNTTKLLIGIGCIVGICLLSGATLGTFPVALSLVIVSSVVIASIFRYVHTEQKRREEKEISGSMDRLIDKLENLKNSDSLSDRQKADKKRTEEKIGKIIAKKLMRTHQSIVAKIPDANNWAKRIVQPISSDDIDALRSDIKDWQEAENLVIQELRNSFEKLEGLTETTKPLIDSFKQAFIGVPHLRRIFPETAAGA